MLQHCSSSISQHNPCDTTVPPSPAAFKMAFKYLNSLPSDLLPKSVQDDLRFMMAECRSSFCLLRSIYPSTDDMFSDDDNGDDPISLRVADEGDCAGSSCWSAPRSQPLCLHQGNGRCNPISPGRTADEGGRAGSSCRSSPRLHHQGSDDSVVIIRESASMVGKKLIQTTSQNNQESSQPVKSISINLVQPSSNAKRLSNPTSRQQLPPSKKIKNKNMHLSSILSLQEFYEYLHARNTTARRNKSVLEHNHLIVISAWKLQTKSSVQSTLTSHHSGSSSVLSTSSVSSSSPLQSSSTSATINPDSSLFAIGAVERNADVQFYRIFGLGTDDHFSCDNDTLDVLKAIPPFDTTNRNLIIVPQTQEVYNSASMTVLNSVSNPNPSLGLSKTMAQAKSFLSRIFKVAYPHFSVSASKSRNLPSISFGWTTTNCNNYKFHRTNIVGQIKPFLIKTASEAIPTKIKRKIAKLSALVINQMSIHSGQEIFTYDERKRLVKDLTSLRESFWHEYAESMGLNLETDLGLLQYFRCDGNSLIINPFVEKHKDSQNDQVDYWDNTLSVNAQLPISSEMWSCPSFGGILQKLGYKKGSHQSVSVSLMIYSRKCVGDYCQSIVNTKAVCRSLRDRGNPIVDCITQGLANVSSDTNYRSLFDDDDCFELLNSSKFRLKSKVRTITDGKDSRRAVHTPQFKGFLSERVAAYDKLVSATYIFFKLCFHHTRLTHPHNFFAYLQRHHSVCIDIILDMAVNVTPMSARHVMETICFMSFDTNGTILICGVFERAMQDIELFRKNINSEGMYQSLIAILKEIGDEHGSKVLGCSEGPRYIYPVTRVPMSQEECASFVTKAIELCNVLRKQVLFKDKKDFSTFKDFNSCLPKGCSLQKYKREYVNARCKTFLKDISNIAGNGVGHMLSLSFFQMSCLVGILPPFLYSWAMISKGSGGYQFINSLTTKKGKKNPSISLANRWITECSTELGSSISANVNLGLLENMLCEFKREEDSKSGKSNKKDYMFFFEHRQSWQNFYRLEFKSATKVSLYMRPSGKDLQLCKTKLTFEIGAWSIHSKKQKTRPTKQDSELLYWENTVSNTDGDALTLDTSKIHVTDSLSTCFKLTNHNT